MSKKLSNIWNSKLLRIILMVALLVVECLLIQPGVPCWFKFCVIIVGAVSIVPFKCLKKEDGKRNNYSEGQTLLKLLVGSLSVPNVYAIVTFFIFLCQLTWCIDIGGKIFVESVKDNSCVVLVCDFFLSIEILLAIGLLYNRKQKNEIKNQERKLLLSGMSISKNPNTAITSIMIKNIDLLLKPVLCQPFIYDSEKPDDSFDIQELLILPSNELLEKNLLEEGDKKDIKDENFWSLVDAYNGCTINDRKEYLTQVIKRYVYVKTQKEISVRLLQSVDYNNFDECYKVAYIAIKDAETKYRKDHNSDAHTIVHTSPGTGAVSAVMSSIAIKSDRQLVYTEQGKEGRLLKINVDVLTLNDLFEEIANETE